MKINKKEKDEEFWPRLLLDKVKEKTNVKIDWYDISFSIMSIFL